MNDKLRVGVIASTRGTNLQAMIDDLKKDNSDYEIVCVISNVYNSGALEKAKKENIPAVFVDPEGKSREDFDKKLVDILDKLKVDLVCAIGYMRILSPLFINAYRNKIINVHPSLIPSFCGEGYHGDKVHKEVLEYGCKVSGMTIHIVDEEVDAGEIVCQKCCEVTSKDTIETLKAKVQELEKEWYPKVVRQYAKSRNFLQ